MTSLKEHDPHEACLALDRPGLGFVRKRGLVPIWCDFPYSPSHVIGFTFVSWVALA